MKTLLLAAGRSRRVKPIDDKNFLKFNGKYLIEHQLEALQSVGLKEILVVGGAHNLEKLREVAEAFGAQVLEQKNLDEGMAGAILAVEAEVGDDELLVVSGNDVLDAGAYKSVLDASNGADATILAYEVKDYFPGGYLEVEGKHITNIVEKPGEGNQPSNLINLVVHLHKKPEELFRILKTIQTEQDDRYELALAELMKTQNFEAVPYAGFWQPVKFPWHVLDLMTHFLGDLKPAIHPSAEVASSAIIKGNVVLEEGVKVMDGALIQGPAFIGKNTTIASNALVRGSMLGERCVVGFNTEIARSFMGDDCWFHSNYVGDTVMGDNCSFGAGAVCANLRLDEKPIKESGRNKLGPILGSHIRVGVNTSIMPGVRVGSNSMITSGLVIAEDVPDGKFVFGKTTLEMQDNRAELDPKKREEMKGKL